MKHKFLITSIALVCAFAVGFAEPCKSGDSTSNPTHPTARELVERIKANVHIPWNPSTVDTFKAGDPDVVVTGIATTHLDTLEVLERAAASGKNFVITHEPTWIWRLVLSLPFKPLGAPFLSGNAENVNSPFLNCRFCHSNARFLWEIRARKNYWNFLLQTSFCALP